MNRIHFQPASQVGNAGDQLINLATINAIRAHGEIVVNDLEAPAWFIHAIGAAGERRFSEFSPRRFHASLSLQLFRQKLAGERLQHYLVLAPGHTARRGFREARAAFGWYARLSLLRLLGCKVVRAGFSIGPFDRLNAWVESLGSRAFDFYGLRDRESLALARRFGFSNPRYFPDLAWSYVPAERRSPAPETGPVVASFRSNAYGVVHDPEYLRPIRERLRRLLAASALAGRRVVLAYQVSSDREPTLELFEYLRDHGIAAELREAQLSIEGAAALYAGAFCVISNRLHALLLAAQSGTLPIALARGKDNAKITSVLGDNGLADLVVGIEENEAVSLGRIDAILRARGDTLQRLSRAREENARCVEREFAGIFQADGHPRRHGDGTAAEVSP